MSLEEKVVRTKTETFEEGKKRKIMLGSLECCDQGQKSYETMRWKSRQWLGKRGFCRLRSLDWILSIIGSQ